MDALYLVSPLTPGSGGLALLWRKDVNITVLTATPNFIDTLIPSKARPSMERLFTGHQTSLIA